MESPVCTPTGSKFSMLQTVMQLPLPSRMTSYSISFQPATLLLDQALDARGEERRPFAQISRELLLVLGDAAARAAQRIRRAHDDRIADIRWRNPQTSCTS